MLRQMKYANPLRHIVDTKPHFPVLYFSENALGERISIFQNGLPGQLTYAVKCNAEPDILRAMVDAGIEEFDVASPFEIALLREHAPKARLNYNNPIRSNEEIAFAMENGVRSFSVDCLEELNKLAKYEVAEIEVSIRLKLDLEGAAYHFGAKFGADEEEALELLGAANALGFKTSMTFHVGTQCEVPENYRHYIEAVANLSKRAGISLHRLNVGGGFPSARNGHAPDFQAFFDEIKAGLASFDAHVPQILAEPGRALIADACQHLVSIKSIRQGRWVFLNDGVYGGLSEAKLFGATPYKIYDQNGALRNGEVAEHDVYGPTCDSIDSFEERLKLPANTREGDHILFDGAGAYVIGLNTNFNGYGKIDFVKVDKLAL